MVRGIATIASSCDQHDVDAARKQRGVDGETLEQILGLDLRPQHDGAVDARTAQFVRAALRQAFDLQNQRRRTIGIFGGAERKAFEIAAAPSDRTTTAKPQIDGSVTTGAPL